MPLPPLLHYSPVCCPFVNCLLSTEDYFKAVFVADSDKLIISWSWAKVLVKEKLSFIASRPLEIPRVLVTSEPHHLDAEGDIERVFDNEQDIK